MKTNNFQDTIKAHLDERASKDELFAVNYAKENKNIEECCSYITSEAKKQAKSGCAVIADDVVFGWAVHYYDEDDIIVKKVAPAKIGVSKEAPGPELEASKEAPKQKKVARPVAKKEQSVEQLSLFA